MTTSSLETTAKALNETLEGLDLAGRLALVASLEGQAVFTTSSVAIVSRNIRLISGGRELAPAFPSSKSGRNASTAAFSRRIASPSAVE